MSNRGKIFKNNPNKPVEVADPWDDVLDGRPSKTEQKKAIQRLKALGEQLAALPIKQMLALPLSEELQLLLQELSNITSHEARRRHFQLLGKRLRSEDVGQIIHALGERQGPKRQAQLQLWSNRIITQGDDAINDFVRQFPAAERHTLRQFMLKVQRAQAQQNIAEETQQRHDMTQYIVQVALLSI